MVLACISAGSEAVKIFRVLESRQKAEAGGVNVNTKTSTNLVVVKPKTRFLLLIFSSSVSSAV